jgi:hypothetical protein
MVRRPAEVPVVHTHHERNQLLTVRPELVEGLVRSFLSIIILTMLASQAYAELRDPTRPAYSDNPEAPIINMEAEPKLSALWINPRGRWATINGIQAKQGETILGNITLIKIGRNSVTISQNGAIKTLELLQRPYKIK